MDSFIGEIRLFAGNYAPDQWAFCDGSLLNISQYTALYSILGTTYGGDGRTTFALPNLNNRTAMHQGQGPGLTARTLGEEVGTSEVTLNQAEMPKHHHIPLSQTTADSNTPENHVWADVLPGRGVPYPYTTTPNTTMNAQAVNVAGRSQPHNNMQPYLGLNYIICLNGIYPPHP